MLFVLFLKRNCVGMKNMHSHQLLNDIMKIILQYSKILSMMLYFSHEKFQIIIINAIY